MSPHDDRADRSAGSEGVDEQRQVSVRLVIFLVVALLVVLLGVDNRHNVRVNYLVGDSEFPLVWVILASLVAGAILGRTWTFIRSRRARSDD